MTQPLEKTRYTVNMPKILLDSLKTQHAETFSEHRLSFNAWLVQRLEKFEELVFKDAALGRES